MITKNLIALTLITASLAMQQSKPVLPNLIDPELIVFEMEIVDPQDCQKNTANTTAEPCEPEFYDGYGILFGDTARGNGPICIDFSSNHKHDKLRCVTLDNVREWILSVPDKKFGR